MANFVLHIWHNLLLANEFILGGVHERARLRAWFSLGILKARSDRDASATSFLSKALWFVCKVAIHCETKDIERQCVKHLETTHHSTTYHVRGLIVDHRPRKKSSCCHKLDGIVVCRTGAPRNERWRRATKQCLDDSRRTTGDAMR